MEKPMSREEYVAMMAEVQRNHAEIFKEIVVPALEAVLERAMPKDEVITAEAAQASAQAQAEAQRRHYRAQFANAAMQVLMEDKELPDEQIVKEAFELADLMVAEGAK